MKVIEGKHLKPWNMLPAQEGTCPDCAVEHPKEQPHNQQSLFYKYKFYNEHGRWPTWQDAMAHCPEEIREYWINALKEAGVEIE